MIDPDMQNALAIARVGLERDAAVAVFASLVASGMSADAAGGQAWLYAEHLVRQCPPETANALAALELDGYEDE